MLLILGSESADGALDFVQEAERVCTLQLAYIVGLVGCLVTTCTYSRTDSEQAHFQGLDREVISKMAVTISRSMSLEFEKMIHHERLAPSPF